VKGSPVHRNGVLGDISITVTQADKWNIALSSVLGAFLIWTIRAENEITPQHDNATETISEKVAVIMFKSTDRFNLSSKMAKIKTRKGRCSLSSEWLCQHGLGYDISES
jgi:hypothetical protein